MDENPEYIFLLLGPSSKSNSDGLFFRSRNIIIVSVISSKITTHEVVHSWIQLIKEYHILFVVFNIGQYGLISISYSEIDGPLSIRICLWSNYDTRLLSGNANRRVYCILSGTGHFPAISIAVKYASVCSPFIWKMPTGFQFFFFHIFYCSSRISRIWMRVGGKLNQIFLWNSDHLLKSNVVETVMMLPWY